MTPPIYPDHPPLLNDRQLQYLLANIKDWSLLNGLAVRPARDLLAPRAHDSRSLAITAPVTLFPSLFPRSCFEEAKALQCTYNELYAAIANDVGWLEEVVTQLKDVDDFINNLWNVHLKVRKEGYVQHLSLGIFRSDYMVHEDKSNGEGTLGVKQVEFNTIASSFGGLAAKVSALHGYLLDVDAYPVASSGSIRKTALPSNTSVESISSALQAAHEAYGPARSDPSLRKCIVFVVQDPENNIFDQLAISTYLQSHHKISVFRLPFASVLDYTSIPPHHEGRPLLYHPSHLSSEGFEVSTVYFRAGYSPDEYHSPLAWQARLHLERSAAIKCPSILTHLAGSKKIQQILAMPSSPYLNRFLANSTHKTKVDRLRATFATIYPLDDSEQGRQALSIARDSSKSLKYVLKPQREGGGNNIYGAKIPDHLASLGNDAQKYRSHILMELIEPPPLSNSIFRNGEVQSGGVIGELGIYGTCLWRTTDEGDTGSRVLLNEEAGYLLRTKGRESEEGGVAAGFGAVDSVCLVDHL